MNNNYLILTNDNLAIQYNDKSVLENHHISASWELALNSPESDIFKEMANDDYTSMRERIISMILSTDMNNHFQDLGKLKGRLASKGLKKIY